VPEIDEDALLALENYSWPGNIRQLRNALRAALALNDGALIRSRDLPSEIATFRGRSAVATTQGPDAAEGRVALNPLQSAERDVLIQGLERHRWKVTGLARELDISRNTLYRKMRRLGIKDLAR
jgi:transcriptional regulator of acetoin/glycerol metabolism